MEALQETLSGMMTMFQSRMSNFEAELKKSTGTTYSTDTLAEDFILFKKFVVESLSCLQQQMKSLAQGMDNLEMRGRRKMLLIHGVAEQAKEDTVQLVAEVVRCHLKLADFSTTNVGRCHRMGRQAGTSKPRPIVCKLRDVGVRDSIWFAKTKLKGTGITVSEFLTTNRHQLFMAARDKVGVNRCWTKQGHIYVLGADGSRQRLRTTEDLVKIVVGKETSTPQRTGSPLSSPSPTPAPKKARRAAAIAAAKKK
ncbi:unnamed protein product [Chrysodeixis includens]|uniref:Uncharacterized protein n=1 Tax=Chrysodeixis includens TaxID=689277 RepID=A0A9N8L584_CHRIL|nr:unnamed protein product [Chrysodeixis includens]